MSDVPRGRILEMLLDEEVLKIIKAQLPAELVADLVLEMVNPHRPLSTAKKAALAGVKPRSIRKRKAK